MIRYLALDIETAYPFNGEQIISAAIAFGYSPDDPVVVQSWQSHVDEASILMSMERAFSDLDPDVVWTWRGGGFDLPIIQSRMDMFNRNGKGLGRRASGRIITTPIQMKNPWGEDERLSFIPGRAHMDLALWSDKSALVKAKLAEEKIQKKPSLKVVGRLFGMSPIAVDTNDMLKFSMEELKSYNESDAITTYKLGHIALVDLVS